MTPSSPTLSDVRAAIEAAEDMPASTKLLFYQNEARHADLVQAFRSENQSTRDAIRGQTRALLIGGGAVFALVVFMVAGFMYLAKVDLDATLRATQGVVESAREKVEKAEKGAD